MLFFYDFEVFKEDWLVVFSEYKGGTYVYHNDPDGIRSLFITQSKPILLGGFNNKHYDKYILAAVLSNWTPEQIKDLSDALIGGYAEEIKQNPLPSYVYQMDLKDDCQQGLSLKAIEGHLGLPIYESDVDFNIQRKLTNDELEEVIRYCTYDVKVTMDLYDIRKNYIANKIKLGEELGLLPEQAVGYTNAKLSALYLGAHKTHEWNDEREYIYPDTLNKAYVPYQVIQFFNRLYDKSIPDDEVFDSKLEIEIGNCPLTISFGGIHGAIPCYQGESTDTRMICNYDVASYYPHLMVLYDYVSRNAANPKIYGNVLDRRVDAKHKGDKATAEALKLVLNGTFGATKNQYNDLYDPLKARSVCISGQLFLVELVNHLSQSIIGLQIVQVNTDGIMIEFDTTEYERVLAITEEWQKRTGFTLEEDKVKRIIQKDVNNYIEVTTEDKIKLKGGMLVRGINTAGAFNINNNMPIVSKAIVDYFVHGTPVEDTIKASGKLLDFQIIAKASGKYKKVMHEIHNELVDIQRCNRVYATNIDYCGTLYKLHGIRNNTVKIGSLPDHCLVDNENKTFMDFIDKDWYISVAKEQINAFIENKKIKKVKEKKLMNIYEKLGSARLEFASEQIIKSGVNKHADFKYFELEDIVPIANRIFSQLKCIYLITFTTDYAIGTLVNLENTDEKLCVTIPLRPIAEPSKFRMNETQAMGAEVTYMRRYLYMVLLDIIEADSLDKGDGRTQLKEQLVEAADELLIKSLKSKLKELKEKDTDSTPFVQEIVIKTKAFTEISKPDCEAWIKTINERLDACTSK